MKNVKWISFVIVGALFLITIVKLYNNNRLLFSVNTTLMETVDKTQNYKILAELRMREMETNGQKLKSTLKVQDENGMSYALVDVIPPESLVFRFSETHCDQCVDEQIHLLKDSSDMDLQNVILLSSYSFARNVHVFKNKYHLPCKIYNLKEPLNLSVEHANLPYFFRIDRDGKIRDVFVAQKELPTYIVEYLRLRKKYDSIKNN